MHDSTEGLMKYLADRAVWVRAFLVERGENITAEELGDLTEALRPIGEIYCTLTERNKTKYSLYPYPYRTCSDSAGQAAEGLGIEWP